MGSSIATANSSSHGDATKRARPPVCSTVQMAAVALFVGVMCWEHFQLTSIGEREMQMVQMAQMERMTTQADVHKLRKQLTSERELNEHWTIVNRQMVSRP